jgi:alkyldihydroxyacetonephosphate synthase
MIGGEENGKRGYALTFFVAYIRDYMTAYYMMAESLETSVPWSKLNIVMVKVSEKVK